MRNVWDADVQVDAELISRLLSEQFPQIDGPFRVLGEGWDNVAVEVGAYVFRFPRRRMGGELIETEISLLPAIAPLLPLPITCPTLIGNPTPYYPYRFAGYRMLPGSTACRTDLPLETRSSLVAPLAAFLKVLHSIPPFSLASAPPGDTIRRSDIDYRLPYVLKGIEDLPCATSNVLSWLRSWKPVPSTFQVLVHGDLYARHLLIDEGKLSGVIDWGDCHLGDPALDLSIAYSFLPASARAEFWDAYGGVDQETRDRARFRALHYASILIPYGQKIGDGAIANLGFEALKLSVEDSC